MISDNRNVITIPQILPLWYQYPSWDAVERGRKFKITSYPRRHGKDVEDLSIAASIAMQRKGSYYYVAPTRKWAKRIVWESMAEINGESKPLLDHIFPEAIVKRKNETELFIELINGSMLFMGGTDNLDFVGQGGQGYTMSEFSLHKEEVTSLLSPIISQGQAYLHMNGTMRGKDNPLYRMMEKNKDNPKWATRWLLPQDTKLYCWVGGEYNINPEILPYIGKDDPKTGKPYVNAQGVPFYNIQDMVDSGLCSTTFARQEYLNEAVIHLTGAYYKHEIRAILDDGRMKPIDPFQKPIYTFWDLGGSNEENDTTSIFFASMEGNTGEIEVVDYYENSGRLRSHYFDVLKQKGYTYAGHYMPHDSRKTNPWNGETSVETARLDHGIAVRSVPKANNVAPSIELARRELAVCTFGDLAQQGFAHLSRYHENEVSGKPCHKNKCSQCGGASHGADAFRTMVEARYHKMITPYLLNNTITMQSIDPFNYFSENLDKTNKKEADDWIIV